MGGKGRRIRPFSSCLQNLDVVETLETLPKRLVGDIWVGVKGIMGRDEVVHIRQRSSFHKGPCVRHIPLIFQGSRHNSCAIAALCFNYGVAIVELLHLFS